MTSNGKDYTKSTDVSCEKQEGRTTMKFTAVLTKKDILTLLETIELYKIDLRHEMREYDDAESKADIKATIKYLQTIEEKLKDSKIVK